MKQRGQKLLCVHMADEGALCHRVGLVYTVHCAQCTPVFGENWDVHIGWCSQGGSKFEQTKISAWTHWSLDRARYERAAKKLHSKQRKEHSTRPNREAVHFLQEREAMHNATAVVPSQKPNIILKEAVAKVQTHSSTHKEQQLGQTMF